MTAWIPRLAKGLAALALLVLLLHSASAQDDSRRKQEILLDELPARVVSDAPFQIIAKSTARRSWTARRCASPGPPAS